jgi:hypothetical protein
VNHGIFRQHGQRLAVRIRPQLELDAILDDTAQELGLRVGWSRGYVSWRQSAQPG